MCSLQIPDTSLCSNGEVTHMMHILEQKNRYIDIRTVKTKKGNKTTKEPLFFWHDRKGFQQLEPHRTGGPYQSFFEALYDAVGPWYGDNP